MGSLGYEERGIQGHDLAKRDSGNGCLLSCRTDIARLFARRSRRRMARLCLCREPSPQRWLVQQNLVAQHEEGQCLLCKTSMEKHAAGGLRHW